MRETALSIARIIYRIVPDLIAGKVDETELRYLLDNTLDLCEMILGEEGERVN